MINPLRLARVAACGAEWWAVASGNQRTQSIAKPLATGSIAVVALSEGILRRVGGRTHLAGLACGLVGDVALLRDDNEARFLAGLGSFLVGQGCYLRAFNQRGMSWDGRIVPGLLVVVGSLVASREVLPTVLRQEGVLRTAPVAAYMGALGAMSVAAWATGDRRTGTGGSLFLISDTVLGFDRFVRPLPGGRLATMVPYLLGQALLADGATTAPRA